jgi:hypothetical protein
MVIQAALLVAVHGQAAFDAVTATLPLPPAAVWFRVVGEMVNAQPESCVTVKVWPATVSVPLRAGPVLAATE